MNLYLQIGKDFGIRENQVKKVVELLDDGSTVPFISRYRKEVTGELDEVAVLNIKESLEKYRDLEKRKVAILKSLKDNDFLTKDLESKISNTTSMSVLEDLYLPFKPKRKTRGVKAKEAGLEPLANEILLGKSFSVEDFYNDIVKNEEDAIKGAKDIIAELINEDPMVRSSLRGVYEKRASLKCSVVKSKLDDDAEKFKDYFKYDEPLNKVPSHRLLAILRGVSKGYLKFGISIDKDEAHYVISKYYPGNRHRTIIEDSIADSYKRLLHPSLETEMKNRYKLSADETAVEIFQGNLRELLLAPPLGERVVLAIDPGLRTGSKVVCLNKQGNLLENVLIKPLPPHNRTEESGKVLKSLCKKYNVEAFSVGNGTGGREMEEFCKSLNLNIPIIMTNESGASIYSASKCAREEFPDLDLTVRGAISIGRRLMDPLAELVKIDPKSIGVGQYQHDVDQKLLKVSLENTVVSCVNAVGVELNTASKEILSYVAGLNSSTASNIVDYRGTVGGFKSRSELLKVKGVGKKAYEQAAGFLRVRNSKNILDHSGVHPERYSLVETMARDLNVKVDDLILNSSLRDRIDLKKYISEEVGIPTLNDILLELSKPGRDPRDEFELFEFEDSIKNIEDLGVEMIVPGIVTNVTAFGAFVDIGVHQDGLVHISQLSNSYISDPSLIVKTGQKVKVKVMDVDIKRKRISLSMKL
ncbi:RNA-binding transcriptional accessory protein [Thiospirochaeta perfilievii]|uniref:RNA-binding transcriptional accessory protein n=1 Tax=Thiospirochaeta perfilievii TaxID=252967 RepID=A0A5C1QEQ2_9SPIO|nr:Tex family protein [Thiospirochaeta perfilievii]QEN06051.1 RNA-binding transcriptional accessory protein [Thiospirochaeta perfilievii]